MDFLTLDLEGKVTFLQDYILNYVDANCKCKIKKRKDFIPWYSKSIKKMKVKVLQMKNRVKNEPSNYKVKYEY